MRWITICGAGLFWAAKWEVVHDSWGSAKRGKKTDQLIQRADSVELTALWLSADGGWDARASHMTDREREANPHTNKARCWRAGPATA